jgi:hypothetical protein
MARDRTVFLLERSCDMVRLASILFMLILLLATASPALARVLLYSGYVRCDLDFDRDNPNNPVPRGVWSADEDGPQDGQIPRAGNVQFFDDDTFTFTMGALRNGALPANEAFTCTMTCTGNPLFGGYRPGDVGRPDVIVPCGTTNSHGEANFRVKPFRGSPERARALCIGPLFEIYQESFESGFGPKCKTGFGSSGGAL